MTTMTSAQVRQSFIDFFAARGHTIVPSASLVPVDDPTLLFTNAGMNQFKDVFLGVGTRPYNRAVNSQKCMRVSGKHNDLDDVGRDGYHQTFFEMLGNWSFGDYYKQEAIRWAWELLTEEWGLSKGRLWATVFKDELGELSTDEEAAAFWRSETGMDPDHIIYFGRKDNFWEMADTGPCGPNSEIHYDLGPEACQLQTEPDHICGVNGDCGRFVELWNLVFIQYNRTASGALEPLPAKHVDTGAGFERLVALLQGVESNYETDLFVPVLERVRKIAGHSPAEMQEHKVAYRVIADHGRAITFLIGDGVLPGNEGRNYVLRMVLRRAVRFGRALGLTEPFLARVAEAVIETMGGHYPELSARRQFILTTITQEEQRFLHTLDMGLARLDEALAEAQAQGQEMLSGEAAFRLYDTFGLPLEITRDVAAERGRQVDVAGYQQALEAQRRRARMGDAFEVRDDEALARYASVMAELQAQGRLAAEGVAHDPYETTEVETEVVGLVRDGKLVRSAKEGERVEVVLKDTCFYVASGGQVADSGFIAAYPPDADEPVWEMVVETVLQPVPGLIVHVATVIGGKPTVGDIAWAVVDFDRRMDIARHHTATHLLHSELRYLLGEHVQQAGSLVTPERLRFDFTHPAMLTQDELEDVSKSVNEAILANYPVVVAEEPYEQAIREGVIALFGEKYGDVVRVLSVGWSDEPFSRELCGGTHVSETGEIGLFHIVSEESVGAGVRRIEAVAGRSAIDLVSRQLSVLQRIGAYLGAPADEVERKVLTLLDEQQAARRQIAQLEEQLARQEFEVLLTHIRDVNGVSLLSARVSVNSMEVLREMTDWSRDRLGSGVVALGAVLNGRPALVAAVTDDLVERGVNAVKLVRGMAQVVSGSGGGRPTLAQAGGRDAGQLDRALEQAPRLLEEMLA
ncbi:MAG: alanine--tRNA ligase [Anaerolineales bacterium]|nr:alanine--tRNA ligase [Anaerolineales bacterium]